MGELDKAIPDPKLADSLWEAQTIAADIESRLWNYIADICGFNEFGNIDEFYFDDITTDYYDRSIEFKDVKTDWQPTTEMLQKIFDYGFSRLWVNYKEGDIYERFYRDDGLVSHKTRQQGLGGIPNHDENWK